MSKVPVKEGGILFETRNELAFVESYGENCVRVRSAQKPQLAGNGRQKAGHPYLKRTVRHL